MSRGKTNKYYSLARSIPHYSNLSENVHAYKNYYKSKQTRPYIINDKKKEEKNIKSTRLQQT